MNHTKRSAFTLVELIVVIAVLAVLAAISFSTVSNVSSSARDSSRLTDVSSMKTALETYSATKGALPVPDNAVAINWSWALVWSQGTFGDNTARQLGNISKPKDPKWNVEYTYSLANNKREYELATVLEKATSFNATPTAFAAGESYDPTIKGNYNGVALKATNGNSIWLLGMPTIIASDVKDANLLNVVLAYPKTGNLPASYVGKATSSQTAAAAFSASQVWSGSALPKTDSEYSALTTALQNAYSGSFFATSNSTIKSLLATSDARNYGANVVGKLSGSSVVNAANISTENLTVSMHFNGNSLADDSGRAWTTAGSPTTTNNSLYFNGNQGLKTDGADFTLGTQDFTIDAWVYPTTASTQWGSVMLANATYNSYGFSGNSGWSFLLNRFNEWTAGLTFFYGDTLVISSSSYVSANSWHHIAISRSNNIFYLFVDGSLVVTKPFSIDLAIVKPYAFIGSVTYNDVFPGSPNPAYYYLDDLRFLKGSARWTSSFTPPTRSN